MRNTLTQTIPFSVTKAGLEAGREQASIGAVAQTSGGTSGYVSAGSQKRSMRGWTARTLSPKADHLPKKESLIASSRDLVMNTPLAGAAINRKVSATVGSGLALQSRIERKGLGLSDEEADAWEQNVERLWKIYAESKDVDFNRQMNFYELQRLAYYSKLLSGEVFFMTPMKMEAGGMFETRVKLIESDLCSTPTEHMYEPNIISGIKFDKSGTPIGYYFSDRFPNGKDIDYNLELQKWEFVPSHDSISGFRNVHHLFTKLRPGQTHGIPFLANIIESLKMVTRLSEAKLMHNLLQTFYTVFIRNRDGVATQEPSYDTDVLAAGTDGAAGTVKIPGEPDDNHTIELGSGSIVELDENKDITLADPGRTDTGFAAFHDSLVTTLGANLGIPRDTLLLHFQASYSSMRGEMLEFYREAQNDRAAHVLDFCQPVFEMWLYEMVAKGAISAPGFMEDKIRRKFWSQAKWGGQAIGQVDPLKETKAAIERINAGLSSREDECQTINGNDWEKTYNRKVREDKIIEANGGNPNYTFDYVPEEQKEPAEQGNAPV